jgi:hypothetical protein
MEWRTNGAAQRFVCVSMAAEALFKTVELQG